MNWSDLSKLAKTDNNTSEITSSEVNSSAIQQMMPYWTSDQALPYDLSTQWQNPQYQQQHQEQNQAQLQQQEENQDQHKQNQAVKQQQEHQLKEEQHEEQPIAKEEEHQQQGTVDCNECSRVFPTFEKLVKHLVNLLEFILLEISTSFFLGNLFHCKTSLH